MEMKWQERASYKTGWKWQNKTRTWQSKTRAWYATQDSVWYARQDRVWQGRTERTGQDKTGWKWQSKDMVCKTGQDLTRHRTGPKRTTQD